MQSLSRRVARHIRHLLESPRDSTVPKRQAPAVSIDFWPPARCADRFECHDVGEGDEPEFDNELASNPPRTPEPGRGNSFTRLVTQTPIDPPFGPEPITRSLPRLQQLLDSGPRAPLDRLRALGADVEFLFREDPDDFLCLLEAVSLLGALEIPAVRAMRRILGPRVFAALVTGHGADFPHRCASLLATLRIDGLAALADHLGSRLERTVRRALLVDLEAGTAANARARLERLRRAYNVRIECGPQAREYERHVGRLPRGVPRGLMEALLGVGPTAWRWILEDVIGCERWRRLIASHDLIVIRERLRAIPAIPCGAELEERIDRGEIARLLKRDTVHRAFDRLLDQSLAPRERLGRLPDLGHIDVVAGLGWWTRTRTAEPEELPDHAFPLLSRAILDPRTRDHAHRLAPERAPWIDLLLHFNSDGLPPARALLLPVLAGETTRDDLRALRRRFDDPAHQRLAEAPADERGRILLHAALGRHMTGRVERTAMSAMLDEAREVRPAERPAWAQPFSVEAEQVRAGKRLRTMRNLEDVRRDAVAAADPRAQDIHWRLLLDGRPEQEEVKTALRRGRFDAAERAAAKAIRESFLESTHHGGYRLALTAVLRRDPAFCARLREAESTDAVQALAELAAERLPNYAGPLVDADPGTRWCDLPAAGTPLSTPSYARLREAAESIRTLERLRTGKRLRITMTPERGLVALLAGVHGEDCSVVPECAHRLAQPGHACFVLRVDGRPQARGYLSALEVASRRERAVLIDVFNPANNIDADPDALVEEVVGALGRLAHSIAGIEYVLIAQHPSGFSNRQSISVAAENLFAGNIAVHDFVADPPCRGFQSAKRAMRVAWMAPSVLARGA